MAIKQDGNYVETKVEESHAAADAVADGIQNGADNVQHNGQQEESEIVVPVKKSEKKRLLIIIGIVAALAVIIGAVFLSNGTERKLQKQLDLGQKYIDELDYEQALASYLAAIEIDPMCAEAYIGAADAYIGMGDYENAEAILEQGYEVTADVEIEEKLSEVRAEIEQNISENAGNSNVIGETYETGQEDGGNLLSLNEHGATVFEERRNYLEYGSLSEAEQSFVDRCISVAESGDQDVAIALRDEMAPQIEMLFGGLGIFGFYTKTEKYKIYIRVYESSSPLTIAWDDGYEFTLEGETNREIYIEIRQENGKAYYFSCGCESSAAGILDNGNGYTERLINIGSEWLSYVTGTTKAWQPDGAMTELFQRKDNNYVLENGAIGAAESDYTHDSVGQGTVVDGLRDGELTGTGTITSYHYETGSTIESTSEFSVTYHNGWLDENGTLVGFSGHQYFGDNIDKDELYW